MLMNVCRSYESFLYWNDYLGENLKGGSWLEIWVIVFNLYCWFIDINNWGVCRVVFFCYYVDKWFWYGFVWRVWLWVGVVYDYMIICMWMNGDWLCWLL